MSKFVRSSKFRHVFGQVSKPEECYSNIKLTKNAWDSNYLAVNPQYVALCWQTGGGGAVGVIPVKKTGKLGDGDVKLFSGHKGPVLDVAFSPFNDGILATASEDCTVKVWQIPEGGLQADQTEAVQVLSGHGRKAGTVNFNPVASNVLATSALDYKVKVWDIETGDEKHNVEGHTNIIQSVDWNYTGSLMATFCKDKKLRVVDPRSGTVVQEKEAHEGVKGGRACWLSGAGAGSGGKLLSVGFSKTAERRFAIWDSRNLSTAITDQGIDTAAGIIMPFYDSATNVLFLAGKGDGTIRYYEIVDDNKAIYYLSSFSSNQPQAGMAALPKRGVNVSTNEIMRLYKAQANIVEPISFTVPRKSDIFQDDLFPDCPSEEAALTASEWSSGKDSDPKTRSMAPGFVAKPAAAASFTKKEETSAATMSADQLQAEYEKLKARVSYLEAEIVKKDAQIKQLQGN